MATSSDNDNRFLLPGGQPYKGTENTAIAATPDEPGMPYQSCSDLTGHPDEESEEGEESPPIHSEADDPSLSSPHPVTAPLCLPEVSVSDSDTSSAFHPDTALPENPDLPDAFTQPDLETTKALTMQTIDPSEHILSPEPQHQPSHSHVNGDWTSIAAKGNLTLDMEEYLKRERQWLLNLAERMRQASTFDTINTLLEITITEVRDHLKVDRVLTES
jgi:methyl-accepting chemotaxis protein PixJ